jgi:MFS family permease
MVLVLLCGAQFLVVLDVTIVAVALPDMRESLGFSAAGLQWVLSAYTLTFGGLLVVAGRAGDLFGRRRLFAAGVAGFGVASLACALAPSPGVLVAARAAQGVAAATLTPAALALLTASPVDHGRAVGWWTAAAAGGGASGWVLGGVLVEAFGWPAVFLVNVPLCALAAAASLRVLPADGERERGRLDVAGGVTVTVGLALLVLGLTRIEAGWSAAVLATAVVTLAAFAVVERRAADPILPAWTLRRPGFPAASGVAIANTASTTPAMFLAILYQQEELGRSALETGLACVPLNLAVIAGSLAAPRLDPRVAMPAGLVAIAAGASLLTVALTPAFVLMGAGLGVAAVGSTAAGTSAVGDEEQGIASGVLNAGAQIGTAVGLAVVVTLGVAAGYEAGYAAAAGIALVAALGVTRSSRRRRRRPTTQHR